MADGDDKKSTESKSAHEKDHKPVPGRPDDGSLILFL